MHLYLKCDSNQRWLVVQLVDGHLPTIAGVSGGDEALRNVSAFDNRLEPAQWFKVMVLRSVTIDCDQQILSWTNAHHQTDGTPVTYSMLLSECYEFDDDVDELFRLAMQIFYNNPLAEIEKESRKNKVREFEEDVMRLLHCHVLSKIVLLPADSVDVHKALDLQRASIAKLEETVLLHQRLAEYYLSQMAKLRQVHIAPRIEQLIEKNHVTNLFLDTLLKDLLKSEPKIRNELDDSQREVDLLKDEWKNTKQKLRQSDIVSRISEARRSRDDVHKRFADLLMLKCSVQGNLPVNDEDVSLEECCQQYMNFHEKVTQEKRESKLFSDKKVLAVSVRECMQEVLKDLKKGDETSGEEFTVDGQRTTDVIDSRGTAKGRLEWKTLPQRILAMISDPIHPVGKLFSRFVEQMEVDYRRMLKEISILERDKCFITSFDDFHIIGEQDLGYNKNFLKQQREVVLSHLADVSSLLSSEYFPENNSVMFQRKLRLGYERSFYDSVGRNLVLMHRVIYSREMQSLENRIKQLQELNMCKLGLQMKHEWWLDLFDEVDDQHKLCDSGSFSTSPEMNGYLTEATFSSDDEDADTSREIFEQLQRNKSFAIGVKAILQKNSAAVLSRSMENLDTAKSFLEMSCELLREDVTHRGRIDTQSYDQRKLPKFFNDCTPEASPVPMRRCLSTSSLCHEQKPDNKPTNKSIEKQTDTFHTHFGEVLQTLRAVFSRQGPLRKMQCLTRALQQVAAKIVELRLRDAEGEVAMAERAKVAVSADDLLPLLVLVLLKLPAHELAKFYVELLFVSEHVPEFLTSGCHSYALCEFLTAFCVLDKTCEEQLPEVENEHRF